MWLSFIFQTNSYCQIIKLMSYMKQLKQENFSNHAEIALFFVYKYNFIELQLNFINYFCFS